MYFNSYKYSNQHIVVTYAFVMCTVLIHPYTTAKADRETHTACKKTDTTQASIHLNCSSNQMIHVISETFGERTYEDNCSVVSTNSAIKSYTSDSHGLIATCNGHETCTEHTVCSPLQECNFSRPAAEIKYICVRASRNICNVYDEAGSMTRLHLHSPGYPNSVGVNHSCVCRVSGSALELIVIEQRITKGVVQINMTGGERKTWTSFVNHFNRNITRNSREIIIMYDNGGNDNQQFWTDIRGMISNYKCSKDLLTTDRSISTGEAGTTGVTTTHTYKTHGTSETETVSSTGTTGEASPVNNTTQSTNETGTDSSLGTTGETSQVNNTTHSTSETGTQTSVGTTGETTSETGTHTSVELPVALISGIVAGGVLFVILVVVITVCMCRRRTKKKDNIIEDDNVELTGQKVGEIKNNRKHNLYFELEPSCTGQDRNSVYTTVSDEFDSPLSNFGAQQEPGLLTYSGSDIKSFRPQKQLTGYKSQEIEESEEDKYNIKGSEIEAKNIFEEIGIVVNDQHNTTHNSSLSKIPLRRTNGNTEANTDESVTKDLYYSHQSTSGYEEKKVPHTANGNKPYDITADDQEDVMVVNDVYHGYDASRYNLPVNGIETSEDIAIDDEENNDLDGDSDDVMVTNDRFHSYQQNSVSRPDKESVDEEKDSIMMDNDLYHTHVSSTEEEVPKVSVDHYHASTSIDSESVDG